MARSLLLVVWANALPDRDFELFGMSGPHRDFELFGMSDTQASCLNGPCMPGNDFCGEPFKNAPAYHLMDQHGCAENDPNGPVFDPVHGVIHHFYQIHLAAVPGHGPDYGHFVSKDFVNWADVRTAIWNGLDASVSPPRVTKYDNEAIFTGSAFVLDGAGPGGKGPGVVNVYPGLCNAKDWPACKTGTLLAQAVPADYANDELLINWTKPSHNPIMENTQRDPSSPWKTPSGEWRLRTYDSKVYAASSDADVLAGNWYEVGSNPDFRTCECPSLYPLPAPTPGFEKKYFAALSSGSLPTHVHKTSCGGDWWQIGTYIPGKPKEKDSFKATPGWEDVFEQRKIDQGHFYASKDNLYPTKAGSTRRINWGWATVPPASAQTLPRELTFNADARQMQQYPIEEMINLRGPAVYNKADVAVAAGKQLSLGIAAGVMKQSEVITSFRLPQKATTLVMAIGDSAAKGVEVNTFMEGTDLAGDDYDITHYPPGTDAKVCQDVCNADSKCASWTYVIRGSPAGSGDCCLKASVPCPGHMPTATSGAKTVQSCWDAKTLVCTLDYTPPTNVSAPYYDIPVRCGEHTDSLRLLQEEREIEIRAFSDWTFAEIFLQKGRVAITAVASFPDSADIFFQSTEDVTLDHLAVFPMKGIWTSADAVRKAPRVYPSQDAAKVFV